MHSIFALAALTAAYAWFTQKTLWRQWLLFLCAVPLAIVGNIVRLTSTALGGYYWGQNAALRYHDTWGGYPGFIIAVLLMMWLGALLQKLGRATPPPAAPPPTAAAIAPTRALAPLAAALLLTLGCGALLRFTPPAEI
jgi:exosortase/archaeosortase family protein